MPKQNTILNNKEMELFSSYIKSEKTIVPKIRENLFKLLKHPPQTPQEQKELSTIIQRVEYTLKEKLEENTENKENYKELLIVCSKIALYKTLSQTNLSNKEELQQRLINGATQADRNAIIQAIDTLYPKD